MANGHEQVSHIPSTQSGTDRQGFHVLSSAGGICGKLCGLEAMQLGAMHLGGHAIGKPCNWEAMQLEAMQCEALQLGGHAGATVGGAGAPSRSSRCQSLQRSSGWSLKEQPFRKIKVLLTADFTVARQHCRSKTVLMLGS